METNIVTKTLVGVRIDDKLKAETEAILSQLGLSLQDYTRMAFHQVVLRRGLPFEVKIPNAETQAAIDEPIEGRMQFSSMADVHAAAEALPDTDD